MFGISNIDAHNIPSSPTKKVLSQLSIKGSPKTRFSASRQCRETTISPSQPLWILRQNSLSAFNVKPVPGLFNLHWNRLHGKPARVHVLKALLHTYNQRAASPYDDVISTCNALIAPSTLSPFHDSLNPNPDNPASLVSLVCTVLGISPGYAPFETLKDTLIFQREALYMVQEVAMVSSAMKHRDLSNHRPMDAQAEVADDDGDADSRQRKTGVELENLLELGLIPALIEILQSHTSSSVSSLPEQDYHYHVASPLTGASLLTGLPHDSLNPLSYQNLATDDTAPHLTPDATNSEKSLAAENRKLAFQALFCTLACPCMKYHKVQLSSTVFPYLLQILRDHTQSLQVSQSGDRHTSPEDTDGNMSADNTLDFGPPGSALVLLSDVEVSYNPVQQSDGESSRKVDIMSDGDWNTNHQLQHHDTATPPLWLNILQAEERSGQVQTSDDSRHHATHPSSSDIEPNRGAIESSEQETALAAAKCLVRMLRHLLVSHESLADSGVTFVMTQLLRLSTSPPLKQVAALLLYKLSQLGHCSNELQQGQQEGQEPQDPRTSEAASAASDAPACDQRKALMSQMLNSGAVGIICQCLLPVPEELSNVQGSPLPATCLIGTSKEDDSKFTSADDGLSEGAVLERNYDLILQSLLLDLCQCACESPATSSAVADRGEMSDLVHLLASIDDQLSMTGLLAIGQLAHSSPACQMDVVKAGVLPHLVRMLSVETPQSSSDILAGSHQTHAARLISSLAHSTPTHGLMTKEGVPLALVNALSRCSTTMITEVNTHDNKEKGILSILTALKSESSRPGANNKNLQLEKKRTQISGQVESQHLLSTASHIACALSVLAQNPDQHFGLVGCGAVPALVTALCTGSTEVQSHALACMMLLSAQDSRQASVVARAGSIPKIVGILSAYVEQSIHPGSIGTQDADSQAVDLGLAVLASLCRHREIQRELFEAGCLPIFLKLMACLSAASEGASLAAEALALMAASGSLRYRLALSARADEVVEGAMHLLSGPDPTAQYWCLVLLNQLVVSEPPVTQELMGRPKDLVGVLETVLTVPDEVALNTTQDSCSSSSGLQPGLGQGETLSPPGAGECRDTTFSIGPDADSIPESRGVLEAVSSVDSNSSVVKNDAVVKCSVSTSEATPPADTGVSRELRIPQHGSKQEEENAADISAWAAYQARDAALARVQAAWLVSHLASHSTVVEEHSEAHAVSSLFPSPKGSGTGSGFTSVMIEALMHLLENSMEAPVIGEGEEQTQAFPAEEDVHGLYIRHETE
ncbi:hypothetical protein CEUSTIGMA_g990.t1 [Chlamydomonas eustigma]|uniref:Armadillo repeat-containing domain-containing protein n=1 Tax=Chlamydomonas eustigma TaxID=1157962 RepID=A0A250WS77_9CHLO|nr:hypothetical protein CEUSTIGMA_g990.t1 [Chlamydomonas eustigma]|eukprot:GAX73539.1 hypothetical protein CEUSTIGMA_g990.t1 [Chlamydomonas eustigma]